jgi:medium-chain acyl-[acyl-carrier-protein] hydrolase
VTLVPTWIQPFTPNPAAAKRLFCFSYSGGGTRIFRPFMPLLGSDIELWAVRLPGREARISETPLKTIAAVLEGLLPELIAEADRPYAFLGHSLGALLAFETTKALRDRGRPLPVQLFLSAKGAPDAPNRWSPIHDLPEPLLIKAIGERYRPIPEAILKEPDLLAYTLPALRGDLEMLAKYRYAEAAPLPVPLKIFGATKDRIVPRDDLQLWSKHSALPVEIEIFEGDHFYIEDAAVIPKLAASIRAKLGG